jgi:hypothetical protein
MLLWHEPEIYRKTRPILVITRRSVALVAVLALLPWIASVKAASALHQQLVEAKKRGNLALVKTLPGRRADVTSRNGLMDQILFKWTGTYGIDPHSRGPSLDARKLSVRERFFGQAFVG